MLNVIENWGKFQFSTDPDTVDRNGGIYFFVYFGSGVAGNVYWYFQFKGEEDLHPGERDLFITVLVCLVVAGAAVFLLLLPMPWVEGGGGEGGGKRRKPENPMKSEMQKHSRKM